MHATLCSAVASTVLLAGCASVAPREPRATEADIARSDPAEAGELLAGPVTSLANVLDLDLCPMQVHNAPSTIDDKVARRSPLACVDGVELAVAPAPGACLSSGFGRFPRNHKGIDYHADPAVDIVAAASGVVRVNRYRADLGNWIVIDHGNDVFTGYGHLANTDAKVQPGATVEPGQRLGLMGNTGSTAVHLHYEVRRGDIDKGGYFTLTPLDPFSRPEACVRDA